MDPKLKSLLTSTLTTVFGMVAGWLVSKGVITADQVPGLIELLVGLAFTGGAAGVAWLKSREHTPAAVALAADKIPGVTVTVGADAPSAVKKVAAASTNTIELASASADQAIAAKSTS